MKGRSRAGIFSPLAVLTSLPCVAFVLLIPMVRSQMDLGASANNIVGSIWLVLLLTCWLFANATILCAIGASFENTSKLPKLVAWCCAAFSGLAAWLANNQRWG